jgi:hypothetical protein
MESIADKESTTDNDKGLFMLTNLNYESWAPRAMKYLLAYPGPWEWIKTGIEPTFITPPLEVPAEVQPRRIQAAARVRSNNYIKINTGFLHQLGHIHTPTCLYLTST